MHLIASEISIPRPESTDEVKVFFPKFFEETYERKRLESFFALMSPARVEINEIQMNPSRYVTVFRPSMLESDFGGQLSEGSRCLYSRWTGYLEREEWQMTKAKLDEANGDLIEVHTSGHIFAEDICKLVNEIAAKQVVPIHTFDPQIFQSHFSNVRILNDGETIEVA